MKYAVIQTGGKQYKVSEGDTIAVERLTVKPEEKMVFDDVLLSVVEGNVQVGTPYVAGMSVTAEVLANMRGEKIRVSKFKAKARYRRTTGHRQELTQLKITQIGKKTEAKVEKVVAIEEKPIKKAAKTVKTAKK